MAASVRIEDEAFSDVRYEVLATLCLLADADHARGKMAKLWRQCTAQHAYVLPLSTVCAVLGENAALALTESGLGESVSEGIRIRGTRGRIEWLKKLRKNAQKGGKAKAAKRQTQGKQKAASSVPPPFPPAPAPAPAKEEVDTVSGKPDVAASFASVAVAEINRLASTRYKPEAAHKLCRALVKAKHTPEQAVLVVRSKREWLDDPKMRPYFRPATLLALGKFATYLDDLDGQGKPANVPRQTAERPEARSPLMLAFDEEARLAAV